MKKIIFALGSLTTLLIGSVAMAAEHEAATSGGGYGALAAAFAIGVAAFGGALAQGRTAAQALEGIARNPSASGKVFIPMIIGLALIESLVIYAFVIAFVVAGS